MGKITGWEKTIDGKNEVRYEHKAHSSYYDDVQMVIHFDTSRNKWLVTEYVDAPGLQRPHGIFSSKAKAMAYAVNYMRRHPNG